MSAAVELIGEKRASQAGGWTRDCRVAGIDYQVSVRQGKKVRIPYKPRGTFGFQWNGSVYSGGRCLWSGAVSGTIGARGLLIEAGVIPKGAQT